MLMTTGPGLDFFAQPARPTAPADAAGRLSYGTAVLCVDLARLYCSDGTLRYKKEYVASRVQAGSPFDHPRPEHQVQSPRGGSVTIFSSSLFSVPVSVGAGGGGGGRKQHAPVVAHRTGHPEKSIPRPPACLVRARATSQKKWGSRGYGNRNSTSQWQWARFEGWPSASSRARAPSSTSVPPLPAQGGGRRRRDLRGHLARHPEVLLPHLARRVALKAKGGVGVIPSRGVHRRARGRTRGARGAARMRRWVRPGACADQEIPGARQRAVVRVRRRDAGSQPGAAGLHGLGSSWAVSIGDKEAPLLRTDTVKLSCS